MSEEVLDTKIQGEIGEIKDTSSYRSIFKATSLFGGVQVYQILVGIIRSKFVAILLGPAGMGIQGLYQSTLDLIKSASSFGIDSSAVRDVSEAYGSGDTERIAKTAAIVNRLVWATGLLGLVLTLVLSPFLSKITFGSYDYTWGFVILSSTLLINQICAGQKVLLQGMRRLKDLAKATAIGSTLGLLVSIPIYYWIGVRGIVPTMVLISLIAMMLSWFYSNKLHVDKVHVSTRDSIIEGRSMLKMGLALSINGILVTLFAFVLRWFIRREGGIDEVGLFTAGFVIINSYVGMVFTAMGTDYYPRLSAVNNDNNQCRDVINQQGEIAILILAPIIVGCIIAMPLFIKLVYADSFLAANDYIMYAVAGLLFKATSWAIAFLFLAKAESRLFVINETITQVYCLILYLLGYYLGGLTGLGISFSIGYCIYTVQVFIIAKRRYGFNFSNSFIRVFIIQSILVFLCLVFKIIFSNVLFIVIGGVIFIGCTVYSLASLNRRMGLVNYFRKR